MKDLIYGVMGAAVVYAIPFFIYMIEDRMTRHKRRHDPQQHLRNIILRLLFVRCERESQSLSPPPFPPPEKEKAKGERRCETVSPSPSPWLDP